jgi:hypothetical protein
VSTMNRAHTPHRGSPRTFADLHSHASRASTQRLIAPDLRFCGWR